MSSWNKKIIRICLTSGKIGEETIDHKFRMDYLGGRGINSRFLFDEVSREVDPLSPSNVLIIGAGALNSIGIPGASRFTITAKSPLTGIHGDSNAGGAFGAELKKTSYDHIIVEGRAEKPVYLWIDNARVEIRDASHIWGKSIWETEEAIRTELGNEQVKVAAIGQAGENLVRFACVINGVSDTNGRTGMGAVMGSKNLKAIAVRGTESFKVAHPEELKVWRRELKRKVCSSPNYPLRSKYGTISLLKTLDMAGVLAARNLSEVMAKDTKNLYHEAFEKRLTKYNSCPGCICHCKRNTKILEGPYKGEEGGMVEFASTSGFGSNCGNYKPDAVIKLTNLCNQYGLDVMITSHLLSYLMDWYEHGLIAKEDTDGIELTWGNWEGMVEMIHKIARREGFGDLLAEGPVRAANQIGNDADNYVSQSKGMTYVGDPDTRPFKGFALNLATSTRGADHLRGLPSIERAGLGLLSEEIKERVRAKFGTDEVMIPTSYNKAGVVIYYQDMATLADTLGLCKFYTEAAWAPMGFKEMAEVFYLVTGIEIGEEGLRRVAGRIYNVERAFSVREGINKKDDYLSGKLGNEPVPGGPFKGESLDREKFTMMLEEYYILRGWNKDTGIPSRSTLEEYGLGDVASEIDLHTTIIGG